jgi:ubiquitin carboxyl-terminal hydrolase 10
MATSQASLSIGTSDSSIYNYHSGVPSIPSSSTTAYSASIPPVLLSQRANLPAAIESWSLDAPSPINPGLTFSQRNHGSPSFRQASSTRSPYQAQRHVSTSSSQRNNLRLSTYDELSESPVLLENTLKLTSLGVSSIRPDPNSAPKVTLSDRCKPDPKVVFDQDRFRRRQHTLTRTSTMSSTSTDYIRRGSLGGQSSIVNGILPHQSTTRSNSESASFSSPTSSTGPLPILATPESSLIVDSENTANNSISASSSPAPLRRTAAAWTKPRSWADLASRMGPALPLSGSAIFSESINGTESTEKGKQFTHSRSASSPLNPSRKGKSGGKGNNAPVSLATLIDEAETQFTAPLTYPRGMINKGNLCFANAILQTLVYCAPFYNLFRVLGQTVPHDLHNSTPLMEAVIHFLSEFQIIPAEVQRNFGESASSAVDALRDIQAASEPFVPEQLYEAMKLNKRFDTMRRGHQEDAEEFLGFILDTLHEELQSTIQKAEARERKAQGKNEKEGQVAEQANGGLEEEEERVVNRPVSPSEGDGWLEVGQKGKTSFTRTTSTSHSPITRIFGGKLRSVLRTPGSKDSVTLEPYQPLQLDIQPAHVSTVEEALENLTRPETISGVMSSTRTLVDATKQVFIETLPPILVLHLKRFYYDDVGGVQKSSKVLGYGSSLEISESVISPARRGEAQRRYKLFGVVYHHGRFASGGHYTVDVLRQDRSEWIHIDDTTWSIASTPQAKASHLSNGTGLSSSPIMSSPRMSNKGHMSANSQNLTFNDGGSAYLLFYVREDAITGKQNGLASSQNGKDQNKNLSTKQTVDQTLPPVSVRRMAEAAMAGPPPVVPGASRTAQKKAGVAK